MLNVGLCSRMSRWVILYTPDKHKDRRWQKWYDGFMQIGKCGRNATIFDEENELVGRFFLRQKDRIFDGADVTTEKYLLQIERRVSGNEPVPQYEPLPKVVLPKVSTEFRFGSKMLVFINNKNGLINK